MLSNFIYQMRKKNKLTQEFLADKLGVSRPTYFQIENGERDITVKEAKKLADIFGIDFNSFLESKENKIIINVEKEKKELKEKKTEIRIDVPLKNIKKLKEVLLYILSKIGSKPNVGETVYINFYILLILTITKNMKSN